MRARGLALEVTALVVIALLPAFADLVRGSTSRCAQDGVAVDSNYAVYARYEGDVELEFCGVSCADLWMRRSGKPAIAVEVTDCVDGHRFAARNAHFVKIYVDWRESVPDPIRVFASREEALAHIREFGGELLVGPRRPLGTASDLRWDRASGDR